MMARTIQENMDFDEWRQAWFQLCRDKGHVLKAYPVTGRVDQFVTNRSICNGPGCIKCGWTACMHCDWKGEEIPVCTQSTT